MLNVVPMIDGLYTKSRLDRIVPVASDPIDLRINGLTPVLGGYVELLSFQTGYFGPTDATIVDKWHRHEDPSVPLRPGDLIEISNDGFASLRFKGRVTHVTPGGMSDEGVTWRVQGLSYILNRWIAKWNEWSDMSYNSNFQMQVDAPQSLTGSVGSGTINKKARWSLGEIIIDVLEHAFGINTPSRFTVGGGYANMPSVSDIPMHHPTPDTVQNPYAHLYPAGAARDYIDQLVWYPAQLKSLLDIYVPNLNFTDEHLWDLIESIVQQAGEHGVFIDPSVRTRPELIVHKFSTSVSVPIWAGELTASAETSKYRILDDQWTMDLDNVANVIRIEGAPTVGSTMGPGDTQPSTDGKLTKLDGAGKVWRVQNQDVAKWVWGWDATDVTQNFRDLNVSQYENYGPVLYKDGAPYTANPVMWLPRGLMLSKVALSGDLRVRTLYAKPFVVKVGPAAGFCGQRPTSGMGSVPLYPNATKFDVFNNYGFVREQTYSMPDFVKGTAQVQQQWGALESQPPPNPTRNDGKFEHSLSSSEGMAAKGYQAIAESPTVRDDTGHMIVLAEETQRRLRDEMIRCRLTIDQIKLSDLYAAAGAVEPGLRKNVHILGLVRNRWSDIALQVMSVDADVHNDRMVLECATTVEMVSWRPPAVQRRFKESRLLNRALKKGQSIEDIGPTQSMRAMGGHRQVFEGQSKLQSYPISALNFTVFADPDSAD